MAATLASRDLIEACKQTVTYRALPIRLLFVTIDNGAQPFQAAVRGNRMIFAGLPSGLVCRVPLATKRATVALLDVVISRWPAATILAFPHRLLKTRLPLQVQSRCTRARMPKCGSPRGRAVVRSPIFALAFFDTPCPETNCRSWLSASGHMGIASRCSCAYFSGKSAKPCPADATGKSAVVLGSFRFGHIGLVAFPLRLRGDGSACTFSVQIW